MKPGDHVGHYRIVKPLGAGGMGAVFEAIDDRIHRRAAIKVLHAGLARDPETVARFFNEARSVNLVRHPGIVQIYELGQLPDGSTFIVMELLEGESLAARVAKGALPEGDAVRVARQVASVLAAAHEAGIIHRDLKPDNVMIVPDPESVGRERAKVLDFGIAKVSEAARGGSNPVQRTQAQALMGTPAFMSPEQCRGAGEVDGRTDVYALGVMTFYAVSARLPFEKSELVDMLHDHLHAPPPALEELAPSVSPALGALVASMLAKDPEARPTMRVVEEALGRLSTGAGRVRTPQAIAPTQAMPTPPPRRRLPWTTIILASIAVAAAAVAAVALTRHPSEKAVAPPPAVVTGPDAAPPDPCAIVSSEACEKQAFRLEAKDAVQGAALVGRVCEAGRMNACDELGLLYERGTGVTRDYVQALRYYQEACDGGVHNACINLSRAYRYGRGTTKDFAKARAFVVPLCEGGDQDACTELGGLERDGIGGPKDLSTAVGRFRRACDAKIAKGCTNLAWVYESGGKGVPKDLAQAAALHRQACDAKSWDSCTSLGILHQDGRGMPKDLAKAYELYHLACSHDNALACFWEGDLYNKGLGVARDKSYARQLYQKACDGGQLAACPLARPPGSTPHPEPVHDPNDDPCPGPGQTRRCNGICVAIDFDNNNCGECGYRCTPPAYCSHLFCKEPEVPKE